MQRIHASSWVCAVALLVAAGVPTSNAYTDPNNYNKLVAFRDSMRVRSPNWAAALQLWTCPTPPANSAPPGACDPCGQSFDGNWYHMHCRGNSRGWGESGDGTVNGITTNMHITSSLVDGPVPKELCIIPTLREHDFGGQLNKGHLTGPFPHWLAKCYPALEELDLSNNRLTGTLPAYLSTMKVISEIKVENNGLIGTIPPELGNIQRLRRFQTEFNDMRGPIPATFKNAAPYLTQFHIARNDYEGDLSMLAGGHLTTVTVHDNPKLCGMVPSTVRFAKGYNPGNTGLGRPCPGTPGAPTAAAPAPAPAPAPSSNTAPARSEPLPGAQAAVASPSTTASPEASTASPSPAPRDAADTSSSSSPTDAGSTASGDASSSGSAASPSPSSTGGDGLVSGSSTGGNAQPEASPSPSFLAGSNPSNSQAQESPASP